MTEQEMNDFLQSIGGLENGMYSNREPITNAGFFECDSGWYQLIKDLITDLIELGWNKEVCQIKEKFGGLRFYINEASDEMHARISKAEDLSYQTCEVTGKPGQLRTDIGWYTTLCEEEYQKILAKRNS
jgi:hypothetical protein